MKQAMEVNTTDSTWKNLYQVGGIAALIMVAITLNQFVVFVVAPPPLISRKLFQLASGFLTEGTLIRSSVTSG